MADFLATKSHDVILRAAYREVPAGHRGALKRAGSQPHSHQFYKLLYHLLHSQRRPEVTKVIQRLEEVNLHRLIVACILPHEILHPAMVARVRDRAEARDVAVAVSLLKKRVIDPKAFADGLGRLRRRGEIREYAEKWVLRCKFASSPVPASQRYIPIGDGVTLAQKAREYRNCSRSYALDLLEGRASMAEFVSCEGSALVMLVRRDGSWALDNVYARGNCEVDPVLRSRASDYLRLRGVFERRRPRGKENEYASLRRLIPRGVLGLN